MHSFAWITVICAVFVVASSLLEIVGLSFEAHTAVRMVLAGMVAIAWMATACYACFNAGKIVGYKAGLRDATGPMMRELMQKMIEEIK